jgi:hypothetical protein
MKLRIVKHKPRRKLKPTEEVFVLHHQECRKVFIGKLGQKLKISQTFSKEPLYVVVEI